MGSDIVGVYNVHDYLGEKAHTTRVENTTPLLTSIDSTNRLGETYKKATFDTHGEIFKEFRSTGYYQDLGIGPDCMPLFILKMSDEDNRHYLNNSMELT